MAAAKVPRSDQLAYTFGVELELVVCELRPGVNNPAPEDKRQVTFGDVPDAPFKNNRDRIYYGIWQKLTSAGIKATFKLQAASFSRGNFQRGEALACDYHTWVAPDGTGTTTPTEGIPGCWFITGDGSLRGPKNRVADGTYNYWDVEVVTPAFWSVLDAQSQIQTVVEVLTSNFRCMVNTTTGLHCHVGNGSLGFATEELRRFFALVWTWDWAINAAVHPTRRVTDLCNSLFVFFLDSMTNQAYDTRCPGILGPRDLFDGIRWIYSDEFEALVELVTKNSGNSEYKYQAYNIRHSQVGKKTIEFRGHEGCLDPDRIMNWVKCCIGLVHYARTADAVEFYKFIDSELKLQSDGMSPNPVFELFTRIGSPFWNLMDHIGLPDVAAFYRTWNLELKEINKRGKEKEYDCSNEGREEWESEDERNRWLGWVIENARESLGTQHDQEYFSHFGDGSDMPSDSSEQSSEGDDHGVSEAESASDSDPEVTFNIDAATPERTLRDELAADSGPDGMSDSGRILEE
jgi:hypothetical protein